MAHKDRGPQRASAESYDGCRLHVVVEGEAELPPVLFINSIGLDHTMWDRQAEALTKHCRTIRYDSRGHGESDVPGGEYTVGSLGRDALAVLDSVGADKAAVVGCSIGGMTAMWFAATYPERVDRLVLANTTAHIGRPDMWNERIVQIREGGMNAVAEATAARWLSDTFKAERPQEAARLVEQLRGTPPEGFSGMCAVLRDVDLRDRLARISAPTLVIGSGGAGPEASAAARLAAAMVNADFVEVPQEGHLSNLESPDAFNAALSRFLGADIFQE